ncbi:polysaccharide deacetylase family protein [Paenibacillus sp. P25]|nr:polysaccharide deacetylase family protein [Paenibacillus sp. P25]
MRIRYDLFPGGKTKALTLSFDDGREYDRRLVRIFNEYGLRGTFHLNSGFLGNPSYIEAGEVVALYAGHEISAHTVEHPFLEQSPPERVVMEIMEDRQALEALAGYPVRGMSYPFGTWNAQVAGMLAVAGDRICAYGQELRNV